MRCSKCDSDNREGRRFCRKCGSKLGTVCPKCGAQLQLDESFCGECGAALGDAAPATISAGTAPVTASSGGERRHLTVLFCDLVGSTEIAAHRDPEEWREVIAGYHRALAGANRIAVSLRSIHSWLVRSSCPRRAIVNTRCGAYRHEPC
jgi:hypothetical protein